MKDGSGYSLVGEASMTKQPCIGLLGGMKRDKEKHPGTRDLFRMTHPITMKQSLDRDMHDFIFCSCLVCLCGARGQSSGLAHVRQVISSPGYFPVEQEVDSRKG